MKSTTLRRSNITREKVAMMEALDRYNRNHQENDFYKAQQSKNRELDALWQSFGVKPQKSEKAPQVYFVTGLIIGVIVTLLITTFVSILINLSTPKEDMSVPVKKSAVQTSGKFTFIPADNTSSKKVDSVTLTNEEYVVKEGDTLESIIIRFYGTFDMNRVAAIQEANNMANPNALSIGQKLIIPMNNQ